MFILWCTWSKWSSRVRFQREGRGVGDHTRWKWTVLGKQLCYSGPLEGEVQQLPTALSQSLKTHCNWHSFISNLCYKDLWCTCCWVKVFFNVASSSCFNAFNSLRSHRRRLSAPSRILTKKMDQYGEMNPVVVVFPREGKLLKDYYKYVLTVSVVAGRNVLSPELCWLTCKAFLRPRSNFSRRSLWCSNLVPSWVTLAACLRRWPSTSLTPRM